MKANKMHGFLCQSNASTAVCIPGDPRSVIVPRRPDRTLVDHARVADLRYARLVDPSRRFAAGAAGGGPGNEKRMAFANGGAPTKTARRERSTAPPKATAAAAASGATATSAPASHPSTLGDVFQVVVMRVSIHCQGCAGKVKKHISKMEGVTSFSIDLESKRVTVMGHISPVAVLERISRVKKAEFWHG